MDPMFLSRLQFAVATLFHFIFVPLTLGLSILVAIMETLYVRSGKPEYKQMTKFWGHLFLINFVVGVVTGITLEFQFGTNWAGYSKYVGDVFGSILAIEATVTFALESTFVAVWFFGWNKLKPVTHAICMWLVAIASNLSAYWIIAANAWMQHPVGYEIRGGRAELTDFIGIITQPYAITNYLHTIFSGFIVAGFFVMGISAYHLLKKNEISFFTKSFRIALVFSLIFSICEVFIGDKNGKLMAILQPEKLAAVESQWETQKGVDFSLLLIPDEKHERNIVELFNIPKFLSFLAKGDWNAEIRGLKSWPPADRPPVTVVFMFFRIMVGLGFLFILLTMIGWFKRNKLESSPLYLRIMLYSIPLPYIAALLGWIVTEVGRQPWIVYRVLRTASANSPIAGSQVIVSLVAFIFVYSLLGIVAIWLMARHAKQGPEPV
ncbi:MAG: cytochrome ubiquinol oxidase subunit I [Desulfomonilaceae bacterium]